MLTIRLQRVGKKNDPSFRLVLTEKKNSTKSGKFKEILGSHNFRGGETLLEKDKINYWIKNGAQVSPTANNLLITHGVIKGEKVDVIKRKVAKTKK